MSFSNPLLDLAIGMIAFFLIVSLMVTALQEGIAQILAMRAKMLRTMLGEIMDGKSGQKTEINNFLNNPIISTMTTRSASIGPSYISRDVFTSAIKDIYFNALPGVEIVTAAADLPENGSPIQKTLRALAMQAQGNLAAFDKAVGDWFDAMMDRLSGKYKRWAQVTTFGIGLCIAAFGNLDTIAVGAYLANAPKERAEFAETLRKSESALARVSFDNNEGRSQNDLRIKEALQTAQIPMGWPAEARKIGILTIIGWLLTASAASLGGAFWFDTLKRFVNIRATGPDEKSAE